MTDTEESVPKIEVAAPVITPDDLKPKEEDSEEKSTEAESD